jgi:hypothetical protein
MITNQKDPIKTDAKNAIQQQYEAGSFPRYDGKSLDKYALEMMKSVFGAYAHGLTAVTMDGSYYNGHRMVSFKTLRDHGRGVQSTKKYKDLLDPIVENGPSKGKRRWTINWTPLRIIPKYRSILKDKLMSVGIRPSITAIDSQANRDRAIAKNKMMIEKNPAFEEFTKGVFQPQQSPAGIDTVEDVENLFNLGGFRLPVEIEVKDFIDRITNQSDLDTMAANMIAEDWVDLNCMSTDVIYENGCPREIYVDPAKVLIQQSIFPDHRDAAYRGYLSYKPYSQLITEYPELKKHKDRLKKGADLMRRMGYPGRIGGLGIREEYSGFNNAIGGGDGMDFGTQVMKLYWLDDEEKYFVVGVRKDNVRQYEEVDANFTLSKRAMKAGKTIEREVIQRMFVGHWVVGTDIVFGVKECQKIVAKGQDGQHHVCWPMKFVKGNEPSLVEKMIPFDDDIQLAVFRKRNVLSKIPPGPRMIIFTDMVKDSVTIAGEQKPIKEILGDYFSDGLMTLERRSNFSLPGEDGAGMGSPIQFVPSGVMEDMQIFPQEIQINIKHIQDTTGVNEIIDGTTQNQDMLKSVMSGLKEASNSALRPHLSLYVLLRKNINEYYIHLFQELILAGDIDLSIYGYGKQEVEKLADAILSHDWLVKQQIDYQGDEAQLLLQDLVNHRQMLPDGAYFIVYDAIKDGDYAKAKFLLIKYIEKAKSDANKQRIEDMTMNAEAQASAAERAAQAEAQKDAAMTDNKIRVLTEEYKLKSKLAEEEFNREMHKIREEKSLEKDQAVAVVQENNANRLSQ